LAVLSEEAVTIFFPSGEKAALVTPLVCPARSAILFPEVISHILAVLSQEAVTIFFPSGEKEAL
jgi:hypothetical protein